MNKKGTKVELGVPLVIDGQKVEALYLRRPKVADLIAAKKQGGTGIEDDVAMLARLSGINPPELEQLDLYDYERLQEEFASFLSSAPKSLESQ